MAGRIEIWSLATVRPELKERIHGEALREKCSRAAQSEWKSRSRFILGLVGRRFDEF